MTDLGAKGSSTVLALGLLLGLAWTACVLLAQAPGYTHFDTAEIFMWSRAGFELNTGRHPPLLPWLVHAVDLVAPLDRCRLMAIATLNALVGAYATWRCARLVLGVDRSTLAMALYAVSPYTTFAALKLNHNAILVSAWPLAAWAFLACLRRPTAGRGVLLGLAAATGVLAKYYVLLLLLAMLVAALWWPARTALWRAPALHVAAAVLAVVVAPHVWATYVADGAPFAHLFHDRDYARPNPLVHALQPVPGERWAALRLIRSNLLATLPTLLVLAWLVRLQGGLAAVPRDRGHRLLVVIAILCAVPYALTIGIAGAMGLGASAGWTSPVFTLLPVVLAGLLAAPAPAVSRRIARVAVVGCVALPLAGPLVHAQSFWLRTPAAVVPRAQIARDAAVLWETVVGRPVGIVGPDQPLATTASLEVAGRPLAWPAFTTGSRWIPSGAPEGRGILALCPSADAKCREFVATRSGGAPVDCRLRHRRRLWGMTGPEVATDVWLLPPSGMRLATEAVARACRAAGGETRP